MSSSEPGMLHFFVFEEKKRPTAQENVLTASSDSKIDLLDSSEAVAKKLRKAEAVPKVPDGNGIIAFIEYVL